MPMELDRHQVEHGVPEGRVKVLVVGVPGILQQALIRMISQHADVDVCASVQDLRDARRWLSCHTAQVVVIDWPAHGRSGPQMLQDLIGRYPDLRWLAVSLYDDHFSVNQALSLGVRAYITKAMAAETICTAIRMISAGRLFCSPDIADALPKEAQA